MLRLYNIKNKVTKVLIYIALHRWSNTFISQSIQSYASKGERSHQKLSV